MLLRENHLMRLKLEVADARWWPLVERHCHMRLAGLDSSIRSVTVRVREQPGLGDDANRMTCELRGHIRGGQRLSIDVTHSEGHTAISLAFARAAREIRRGCQRGGRTGRVLTQRTSA